MIEQTDQSDIADAAQGHNSLAVLGRLFGVSRGQLALRAGQGAKVLVDIFERLLLSELSGHHEHGIIGLVEPLVEGPQAVDRNPLDIRAVADGGLAVVVPFVGHGRHPLRQHAFG